MFGISNLEWIFILAGLVLVGWLLRRLARLLMQLLRHGTRGVGGERRRTGEDDREWDHVVREQNGKE